MSAKRFSLMCVGITLLLFGVVGLLNAIVDPFWYFRMVEADGFNLLKPKAPGNERLVKAALVAKIKPEAVIVGNSFAEIGLPPLHAGFTRNGLLKSFNLGVQGADWSEVYCLAMFALRQPQLERLVVGVSGTDSGPCPTDDELGGVDYGKLLFSRTALDASLDTLHQQHGNRAMTREGLWNFVRNDSRLQTDDQVIGNFALWFRGALCPSVDAPPRSMDPTRISKAPPPPGQDTGLRQLVRLALARKVELVLLFYPTHVLLNESGRRCDGPEAHWNYLWHAVAVANQEAHGDTEQIQIWDFFGYGPLNTERLRAGKPMRSRLWQDFGHFNTEVGSAAFDAIFSGDTHYGARVTAATFDQVVARTEEDRKAFLEANDWVVPELNELVQRARAMPIRAH